MFAGNTERRGDFQAQIGSLKTGESRLLEIVERRGVAEATEYATHLIAYSARLMRHAIEMIPDGDYEAEDWLDDDGISEEAIPIRVKVKIKGDRPGSTSRAALHRLPAQSMPSKRSRSLPSHMFFDV